MTENFNGPIGCEDTEEDELTIKNHQYPANQDFSIPINSKPIISFGIITDIQYADIENGLNYVGDKTRYYRNSLNLVKESVQHWHENIADANFKFIIQLGDIIDGKSSKDREDALSLVLNELKSDFKTLIPDFSLYHIWGNHEFYCFKRDEILATELNSAKLSNPKVSSTANYYKLDLTDEIKLICLDFYENSALGYDETHDIYKDSLEMLRKHNPNEDLNSADGLRGHGKRFTKFNGSLSQNQFVWLQENLKFFKENNLKVIICGHLPVHPQATASPMCLAWNYKEVLDLFAQYEKTLLAYLCGHDHDGGYFRDKSNIHHLTFAGIIETPPNSNSFATIKVFDNKISIEGVGLISYYEIYY
jgi:manganese-dependent ADP-ribose/CDP-alcohol diphosphatase